MEQEKQPRFIRPAETARRVGVCPMTLWRWEAAGIFPKRFKLNATAGLYGAAAHDAAEVDAWFESRRASRETA